MHRYGVLLASYGDHSSVFVRNKLGWSRGEQLARQRQATRFGGGFFKAAGYLSPRKARRPKALQERFTCGLRLAQAGELDTVHRAQASFIADYNGRVARTPREAETADAQLRKI